MSAACLCVAPTALTFRDAKAHAHGSQRIGLSPYASVGTAVGEVCVPPRVANMSESASVEGVAEVVSG